jgi:hypothetical protein
MDKAMELKEKKNNLGAATKMIGIIKSNPFHVLQVEELSDMARKVGIHVDTTGAADRIILDDSRDTNLLATLENKNLGDVVDVEQCKELGEMSDLSDCPRTPYQYNTDQEFDDRGENVWIYVTRKKWSKHPRKIFR